MTFFRRMVIFFGVVLLLTGTGVFLHALWLSRQPDPAPADIIIVLGGDMTGANDLGPQTRGRVRKSVELYKKGLAPCIHFTGGIPDMGRPGAGTQMADLAMSLGVPASAIAHEDMSRSTIQNALFSRDILGPEADGSVLLVSDGYHLARSWVSFRWAGYEGPITLVASSPFGIQPRQRQARDLAREVLAWWFNLARVATYEVLDKIEGPDPERVQMLS